MSNDIRKMEHAVHLPYDVVPTVSASEDWSPKDSVVIDQHPYRTAFLNGVSEGFKLPFAALFGVFGLVGCDSGSRLHHYPNEDSANADSFGETSSDGGSDTTTRRNPDTVSFDGGTDVETPDLIQSDADDAVDGSSDDAVEISEDATSLQDATTDVADDVEDAIQDAAADMAGDVTVDTAVDAAEDASGTQDVADAGEVIEDVIADTTDAVDLPGDTSGDVGVADADVIYDADAGICQYFCDAGVSETSADLPADVTMADDATQTTGVVSALCGPIAAPANSVAVACSNSTVNTMLQGVSGCVAECGFFDNNISVSSDPKNPVPFALALFAPPVDPKQTITLALNSPILSDGSATLFPGFMGSSFVFAFDQKKYDTIGEIQWNSQDKDVAGNLKGTVQITYMPFDFFFQLPEVLDITYTDLSGNKMGYRYPCDTLPNPQIQCTEVK